MRPFKFFGFAETKLCKFQAPVSALARCPMLAVALSWLAGASAFYGPAVRIRRVCTTREIGRAAPAVASLGELLRGNASDQAALRELDELQLSYMGWPKDIAELEVTYVNTPWLVPGGAVRLRRKQQVHDGDHSIIDHSTKEHSAAPGARRLVVRWYTTHAAGGVARQVETSRQDLVKLKRVLTYQGWQADAAVLDEAYIEGRFQRLAEIAPFQLAKMCRQQQVHERRLKQEAARLSDILNASPASLSYTDAGTLAIYIPPRAREQGGILKDAIFVFGAGWVCQYWARSLFTPIALPVVLSVIRCVKYGLIAIDLKQNLIDPATDTTLTIGRYEWRLRRTVAGVVTREVEGSTDTLLSADTQPWGKMRRWFRYSTQVSHHNRNHLAELRLNQADGDQSVLIDAELHPWEVATLAAKVNAHLEGLGSETAAAIAWRPPRA